LDGLAKPRVALVRSESITGALSDEPKHS
jgi:hypothetical protein